DPVEDHLDLAAAEERVHRDVVRERVEHDHGIDVVEHTGAGELLLAAAALLGGGADQRQPAAEALVHPGGGEEPTDGGGADDVVAARVADPGQRVVLGEQDRKSTRLNSSHVKISYAVFCLKKKTIAKSMACK